MPYGKPYGRFGIAVWDKSWQSKRILVLSATVGIIQRLVQLVTLGWLLPDWELRFMYWWSTRDDKREGGTDDHPI